MTLSLITFSITTTCITMLRIIAFNIQIVGAKEDLLFQDGTLKLGI